MAQWIDGEKLSQSISGDVGSLVNLGVLVYLTQLLDTGFFHGTNDRGTPCLGWCFACRLLGSSALQECKSLAPRYVLNEFRLIRLNPFSNLISFLKILNLTCPFLSCPFLFLFLFPIILADPHPGNMLRTPDGKLVILDFGLMTQVRGRWCGTLIENA